jgi:hypothetical protein
LLEFGGIAKPIVMVSLLGVLMPKLPIVDRPASEMPRGVREAARVYRKLEEAIRGEDVAHVVIALQRLVKMQKAGGGATCSLRLV